MGPLEASDRMQNNSGKKRILSERSEFIRDPNFSNECTVSKSGFSGCVRDEDIGYKSVKGPR